MEVMMSADRKTATLYNPYIDKSFGLYHSEGKVEDLVLMFLMPSSCPARFEMTMTGYMNSFEDTAVIEIEMLDAA